MEVLSVKMDFAGGTNLRNFANHFFLFFEKAKGGTRSETTCGFLRITFPDCLNRFAEPRAISLTFNCIKKRRVGLEPTNNRSAGDCSSRCATFA